MCDSVKKVIWNNSAVFETSSAKILKSDQILPVESNSRKIDTNYYKLLYVKEDLPL